MADDIRVIADTLKLENATLVGFSMGGAIAIRYMARHAGHRMCSLILAAAAAPLFTRRPDYPYGMSTQEVDAIIASAYTDRPQMLRDFGANFFAEPISDAFRNWFHQLGVDASSYGTIKSAESLRDEDLRADLAYIQVPTTILHGKLDKICPFAFAEVQHKGIRNSRLVSFEYSGHGLFHDELQKFNYEMLTALKQFTTSPRF
jgi:non-heme chloroperoxidase